MSHYSTLGGTIVCKAGGTKLWFMLGFECETLEYGGYLNLHRTVDLENG